MPDFVQTEIKAIDDQLRILKDEASRLEAARAALTGGARRRGRPATNGAARMSARPASRRNGRAAAPRSRRGGNTRANQALELVRERPGITIPEVAKAMKIEPNYLYRVLPPLASMVKSSATARGGIRRRRPPPPRGPWATFVDANRAAPPSRGRRPPQLASSGLSEPQHRHLRPTAAPPAARPRRRCSPRSREVRR